MGILRSIVAPSAALMASCDSKITGGGSIRSEIICDERLWDKAIFLQKLAHQFERRPLVPPALDQHIEDLAFKTQTSCQAKFKCDSPAESSVGLTRPKFCFVLGPGEEKGQIGEARPVGKGRKFARQLGNIGRGALCALDNLRDFNRFRSLSLNGNTA
jgi:hypothetical protein